MKNSSPARFAAVKLKFIALAMGYLSLAVKPKNAISA